MALQRGEVSPRVALRHVLVAAGAAPVVLQQALPPALAHGAGPLCGLWHGEGDSHPPRDGPHGQAWGTRGFAGAPGPPLLGGCPSMLSMPEGHHGTGVLWGGDGTPPATAPPGTNLGSRSEAACCPEPSECRRSPALRHPRTSSTRCCRGIAGAGTDPLRRTGARARHPRARVPAAMPVGTAARAGRASAAACSLTPSREPKQQQSEDGGRHPRQNRRGGELGSLTVRTLEAIALVAGPTPAGEGAWRVVAGGGRVARVFGTLIHICEWGGWGSAGMENPGGCPVRSPHGPSRSPVPEQSMPSPAYPGRHSQVGWPPAWDRQRARSAGAQG